MPERSVILDPESLPMPGAKWDWSMTGLLAALFGFMPFAFGVVEPWSELIVILAAAALSLCLVGRVALDREFHIAKTLLYLPLLLFLLLVVVQQVRVPAEFARSVAPWNVETKERLLGASF